MPQYKIDRMAFIKAQGNVERKPKRRNNELTKKIFAKRDFRLGIRNGARYKRQIIVSYTKITTGEHKNYKVNPYSYRYRHTRDGVRKMLFAEDVLEHRIKGFVLRMINHVEITDKTFKPRWRVEIE